MSTGFIHSDFKETIVMEQTEGYNNGSGKVCCLIKRLNSLKRASRYWNEKFSNYIVELGFQQGEAYPSPFVRQKEPTKIFFILYVDDELLAADCKCNLQEFIKNLKREFKVTTKLAYFFWV